MDSFKRCLVIVKSSFLEWGKDVRIRIMFLMEFVLLIRYLLGLTLYGLKFKTTITPLLLPILFENSNVSNGNLKILICLGAILLFSNAPFIDERTPYLMVRSKRGSWWKGECMYIWSASFLYLLFLSIVAAIIVIPTASLQELWGSTLREVVFIANSGNIDIEMYLSNLIVPQNVIKMIYPYAAQLLTFAAGWVSFAFLGHLIYAVNLTVSRPIIGIAAGVFFVMLAPVVKLLGTGWSTDWLYWISPINWSSMSCWKIKGSTGVIPMWYALGMPVILTVILSIIIGLVSRKKQIDVLSSH